MFAQAKNTEPRKAFAGSLPVENFKVQTPKNTLYVCCPVSGTPSLCRVRTRVIPTLSVGLCQVRQYAAYALVKVGQNSDVRKQVTDEGGLEPVLYLARTEEPEIQRETLACLCSLSFAEENKITITRYGGLPPIMSAIRSPDVQTARMACCACANLCEVVENMDNVVDAGGIPALVQVGMFRGELGSRCNELTFLARHVSRCVCGTCREEVLQSTGNI